ncbi:MAG: cyclic nucleotide-binding domain-containing protein [Acidimicrobiales bacterium]
MAKQSEENQIIDRLAQVPLFHRTSKKQRQTLAKLGKTLKWSDGSVPIKQGSKGAAFFLILEGAVDVSVDGQSVARLSSGDFVGEIALLTNKPRNATVTALADCTVFAFGRPGLAAALKTDPNLGIALLEAMASRQNITF